MIKDKKVDLHLHTTASDGTWKPERLVEKIIEADIGLFSVTDHDTTENVDIVYSIAKEKEISFIKGVEINTSFEG